MTAQSAATSTSPAPAAGRHKTALRLLGVSALAAFLVLALIVWQRANQGDPPAPAAAGAGQTIPPLTVYLVETADDAVALGALLLGDELALVAGTADEAQQVNVPDREVVVIDRRSR